MNELRHEKRYLSKQVYRRLCNLSNVNFDKFIDEIGFSNNKHLKRLQNLRNYRLP